jgi:cobalt-precorrin-7 (C5)-methyltransferase
MKIVGVGCGPGMITDEAAGIIREAELVYGSRRAIEMVQHFFVKGCEVHEIKDYRNLDTLPGHAVILSTGDPMLAGLGYLPGEVTPGISSLQIAAARLHLPLARVSVVLAHGRDHARAVRETREELSRGKVVFLIPDPQFDVSGLAGALAPSFNDVQIVLCEDLGYPSERVLTGSPAFPPVPGSSLFSLIIGDF